MPAPLMAAGVWAFIVGVLPGLLKTLFITLGITAVTFTGLNTGVDAVLAFASTQLSGLPSEALQIAGILRVDVAISMVLSAHIATFALGSVTRWRTNRAGIFS